MPDNPVAYVQSDPVQTNFLNALAQGETAGSSYAASEGFGGINLFGHATDQNGFPIWEGVGNTHAAGVFQFQPSTWSDLAQKYGLNFQNESDQYAGAWYLAQDNYAAATGGKSLYAALSNGDYQSVQSSLAHIWPSVGGNASQPGGLANALASGRFQASSDTGSSTATATAAPSQPTSIFGAIENFFERFGLIIIGGIIVIIALWQLLSKNGIMPSPSETAKAVATL